MLFPQNVQIPEFRECQGIKGEGGIHLILELEVHTCAQHQSASDLTALYFCSCDLSRVVHSLLLLSLAQEADFQPG